MSVTASTWAFNAPRVIDVTLSTKRCAAISLASYAHVAGSGKRCGSRYWWKVVLMAQSLCDPIWQTLASAPELLLQSVPCYPRNQTWRDQRSAVR